LINYYSLCLLVSFGFIADWKKMMVFKFQYVSESL
jgi:hypothetical protein